MYFIWTQTILKEELNSCLLWIANKNEASGITLNSFEQGISLPNTSRSHSYCSSSDTPKERAGIPIYDLSHDN
jgi:hypothetical protein